MAFSTVNVGVAADDNSGDTNRAGWQKVNANFADAQTQINAKAAAADLADEVALRDGQLSDILTALDNKVNVGDDTDPSTVQPRFDAAQTISNDQRRQLATNTGGFVTLPFPLVDGATDIATGTVKLPMFPQNFILCDLFVMLTQRTAGTGGTLTGAFSLDQGATNIAGQAAAAITAAGKMSGTIAIVGRRITKELPTTCSLAISTTETGAPVAKGATLWLRGVWET